MIFILIFAGIFAIGGGILKKDSNEMTNSMLNFVEYAYMEGQRDAIEGDIRIEKIGDDYVWTKSPWDEGAKPAFKYLSEYGFELP